MQERITKKINFLAKFFPINPLPLSANLAGLFKLQLIQKLISTETAFGKPEIVGLLGLTDNSLSSPVAGGGTAHPTELYQITIEQAVRVGDYRVIHAIDDDLKGITIYQIGHRREIYD